MNYVFQTSQLQQHDYVVDILTSLAPAHKEILKMDLLKISPHNTFTLLRCVPYQGKYQSLQYHPEWFPASKTVVDSGVDYICVWSEGRNEVNAVISFLGRSSGQGKVHGKLY